MSEIQQMHGGNKAFTPISERLPNELWIHILSLATTVPGALNTEPRDPFDNGYSSTPFVDYDRREMNASLSTKLALTLTCKKWNLIATPLLYEVIIMPDDRNLHSLYKALTRFHHGRGTSESGASIQHGPGWWTRRFELHKYIPAVTDGRSLCGVLRSLPRLQILCVTGGIQPRFFDEAMNSLPKSLRKLHFDSVTTSEGAIKALLARCSLLRSVVFVGVDTPISSGTLMQAPTLRLTSFGSTYPSPETIVANPHMQQLYIALSMHQSDSLHPAEARALFFKVQGAHLTTVYVDIQGIGPNDIESDADICIRQLREYCPNMAHIVLIIPKLWYLPLLNCLPASVTHLGVYCVAGEARPAYWSSFCYFLSVLSDDPAVPLRVVRLLNQRNAENFRRSSVTLFTLPELDAGAEPSTMRRSKRIKLETPTETIKSEVQTTTIVSKSSKAVKAKEKAPRSPRKPKAIPQALATPHPAPARWKETYDAIKEMRSKIVAPVDTMGCDRAQLKEDEPKARLVVSLSSVQLGTDDGLVTKDEVTDAAVSKLRTAIGGSLNVDALIAASEDTVAEAINKVGFWRRKTQYLKQAAQKLRDSFDSDVPKTVDELCSLPGVGPKMAFLALQVAWNLNLGIGVDVHVHRITNRLGWHKPPTKNPEETRLNLQSWLPKELHGEINHLLVGFGQVICLPVGPKCDECTLSKSGLGLCPSAQSVMKSKSRTKKTVTAALLSSGGPKLEISIEESTSTIINVPPTIETISPPVSPLTAASDSES
ncbi:hypothetical protein EVG20_g1361 [Dentipellis fragilis]|uniref:Endonuclease III homolog n=1 Tax=Dentipellis fragilis TaxID=205917 RepID=A0A4Y9ZCX0_9AGAM|nr:hypothetical protein EVG20_g1361 [Dentipellis fragilis]